MSHRRILEAVEAHKQFHNLVQRASRGEITLIIRHGKPCAALVPPHQTQARRRGGFLRLRGSGKGLYGNVACDMEALRREWD